MIEKSLRLARILVSVGVLVILACGLTCSSLMLPVVGPWLERIQLGPAVMAFSMFVFVGWLLITLLFGRIYCSTVCPMGTLLDCAARLPRLRPLDRFGSSRNRYRYMRPARLVRCLFLIVVLLASMAGFMLLPSVLEPYAAFCRVCTDFFSPVLALVSRLLESVGIRSQAAAVMITASAGSSIVATLIFAVAVFAGAQSGRILCNTICPVGTALGFVSRFSIYQMDIDTDLCINCGKCEDVCKASCINLKDHTVDGSRCVVCFDCSAVCPNSAIRYTWRRKQLSTPQMQRITGLGVPPEASVDSTSANCRKFNDKSSNPGL